MRAPSQSYGQQAEEVRQQRALPVTTSPQVQPPTPAAPARQSAQIIALDAPTRRPNEPVTAGAPLGPGPGPAQRVVLENAEVMRQYLPALERLASNPAVSEQTRNFVRFIRSAV